MSDIEIKNLSFSYDKCEILKNINLNYDCSDFLCIFGPNGGGKSTLFKLILGLLKPQSGEIKVFGDRANQKSKKIAYVPQNIKIAQNFPISAQDVVLMGFLGRKIFGFYSQSEKKSAMKFLELVGMDKFAKHRICDLSGGQRQRVYIARALAANARILLLDEPTASIDTVGQIEIYTLLKELNKKIGIIMISHDVNLALNYASKAAYITNKTLFMHDISNIQKDEFLSHIKNSHHHFCDIELALKECSCGQDLSNKSDFKKHKILNFVGFRKNV